MTISFHSRLLFGTRSGNEQTRNSHRHSGSNSDSGSITPKATQVPHESSFLSSSQDTLKPRKTHSLPQADKMTHFDPLEDEVPPPAPPHRSSWPSVSDTMRDLSAAAVNFATTATGRVREHISSPNASGSNDDFTPDSPKPEKTSIAAKPQAPPAPQSEPRYGYLDASQVSTRPYCKFAPHIKDLRDQHHLWHLPGIVDSDVPVVRIPKARRNDR